jgi:hypothetical protein
MSDEVHHPIKLERCERFAFSPAPYLPPAPHILGSARRP